MAAGMVVIGAGEAGARAVGALREQGFGGPVTLIGDEPHSPYERPPLSKAVMTAETVAQPPFILDEAKLAQQAITHLAHVKATHIDTDAHAVTLSDGRTLAYDTALIATGAAPRRLTLPGAEHVLYLRTFADALAMRDRLRAGIKLAVIGGGFIGLEIAASAIERRCDVTLIEAAPRILMRGVPAAVAERVQARHEAAGVRFSIGTGIERIVRDGEALTVALADSSTVACDVVIAGIGAVPETALAEASGIAVENGVKVDATLRASAPDVFAAGDCCSFPHPLYGGRRLRLEAWRNAQDQGALAARNMLGGTEAFAAVPWFWSDQYDQNLQVAGLADEAERTVTRDLGAATLFFHLAANGRLVGVSAIGPNALIARDIRLAEMLIAKQARPDVEALAAPRVKLKGLL